MRGGRGARDVDGLDEEEGNGDGDLGSASTTATSSSRRDEESAKKKENSKTRCTRLT